MEKHNGIITFSEETYKNILSNIRENSIGDLSKIKDPDEAAYYYLNLIMLELERDLGEYFFDDVEVSMDTHTMFDFKTGKISLNPKETVDQMNRVEFLVKKCRYAGANAKSIADYPSDLYYRDIYHVYEILRYVFIKNIFNISQSDESLSEYYRLVVEKLCDPKVLSSKKFAKAEMLSYLRYANASAGKFICELYKNAKPQELEGCFQLLGYILYTENLCIGYTKSELFKSNVPTTPIAETCKVLGIEKNIDLSNLSFEERVMHGYDIDEKEKALIKSVSFDPNQGKPRGNFTSFYGQNGKKGIFK